MESVTEIWKDVKGYEGLYQVSNCGNARSLDRTVPRGNGVMRLRGKALAPAATPRGYQFVSLYGNGCESQFYLHRLVAEAFIGPCPEGHEVNHKDGNKANNSHGNLEYKTHADNLAHARETGLMELVGENNPVAKYTPSQIRQGYLLVKAGHLYAAAARECGVNQDALEAACRGATWKSLGLKPIHRSRRKELVA